MADPQIRAVITAEDKASSVLKGFGNSLNNARTGSLALLGGLTAMAGAAALTVKAFAESEDAAAQLDAVLKSTAGVAGVTSDAAIKLSKSLQSTTTFSDEAVLSAESLLLTFTKIGKDIFPQATETVLDMATALGEDTKSAAIQLGKALQDPVLGITALRRVGVNFSDAQKDVIQNLVDTGKTAEAQKLILQELNTEFGGSATRAAKTFSGQLKQVANIANDVEEAIGKVIADAIRPFIQALVDWGKAMGGADGIAKTLLDNMTKLKEFMPVIIGGILGGLIPAFGLLAETIWFAVAPLIPFMLAGAALGVIVKFLIDQFGGWDNIVKKITPSLQAFGSVIASVVMPAFDLIKDMFQQFIIPFFEQHKAQIKELALLLAVGLAAAVIIVVGVLAAFAVGLTVIVVGVLLLIDKIAALWNWLNSLRDKFNSLPGLVKGIFEVIGNSILTALGPIGQVIKQIDNLRGAISSVGSGAGISKSLHSLHVPGFASGVQNFSGGLAVVGEKGPELVNLPRGSNVTPNNQIGQSQTVNITIQAGAYMGNPSDARKYAQLVVDNLRDIAGAKNMSAAELLA